MKRPRLPQTFFVMLTILIVTCFIIALPICQFHYANIWKCSADFETYEAEFALVRDYVMAYMGEKSGVLSVSRQEPHKYDLYNSKAGVYLECPENVRNALEVISQQAFYHKDAQFEGIYCNTNQVEFAIESGPYRLVYSPEKEPVMQTYSDADTVLYKKIKDGWYHVTVWSQ